MLHKESDDKFRNNNNNINKVGSKSKSGHDIEILKKERHLTISQFITEMT